VPDRTIDLATSCRQRKRPSHRDATEEAEIMIRPSHRRVRGLATWSAALLVAVSTSLVPKPAGATLLFTLVRLSGTDRYATSAQVAQEAFATAPTAILATGASYPDALAASFLAGDIHAPILLTTPDLPLAASTTAMLTDLGTKTVILVGGTSAVSQREQAQLTLTNGPGGVPLAVTRISGVTRYDTMEAVDEAQGTTVGMFQGKRTAFLATGENFPDALGAAPVSYAEGFPIILTQSQSLAPQASATLLALGIQQVLILGGTSAVSAAVESAVNAMGIPTLQRFAGADRSGTSALLAQWAISNVGFKDTRINVASGDPAFGGADALSTGPLGGSEDPVATLLTNSATDPGQVIAFASQHSGTLAAGFAIGGGVPLPQAELIAIDTAGEAGSGSSSGGSGGGSGGGGSGGGAVTGAPALVSASVVSITPGTQSSPNNPAGIVIQYDFSEPLTGAKTAADFKAWPADDGVASHAGYNAGAAPSGICGAGATCPAALSSQQVNVLFAQSALQSIVGPDSAGSLTLATVASGAVTGTGGMPNPPGSAPISAPGRTGASAGVTQSPYITGVSSSPRMATAADSSAIDVSFDVAAYPQAATTSTGAFDLVFAANVVNTPPTGPVVAGTNNEEEECTGPSSSAGTLTTGLLTPVYNLTAQTVTIVCPNPASAGAPMTLSQIAWIVVQPNAIGSGAPGTPGTATNALLDVSATLHASALPVPRLAGVSLTPGTTGNPDVAAFTFDQPVTGLLGTAATIDTADFDLVQQDGGTVAAPFGDQGGGVCSTSAPASYPGCQVLSSVGDVTVDLVFPNGTFRAFAVVGGAVRAGAVVNANNQAVSNADDELGAGGGVTSLPAGSVNAIQLTGAALNSFLNPFGVTIYTVTYTFSEAVSLTAANQVHLHLYDGDGTLLECAMGTATLGIGAANNQVTCPEFNQGITATPATAAQLAGAVLATVDYATATGNAGFGVANQATNNYPNPEGQQSV